MLFRYCHHGNRDVLLRFLCNGFVNIAVWLYFCAV